LRTVVAIEDLWVGNKHRNGAILVTHSSVVHRCRREEKREDSCYDSNSIWENTLKHNIILFEVNGHMTSDPKIKELWVVKKIDEVSLLSFWYSLE
jgi:hypothetical protein